MAATLSNMFPVSVSGPVILSYIVALVSLTLSGRSAVSVGVWAPVSKIHVCLLSDVREILIASLGGHVLLPGVLSNISLWPCTCFPSFPHVDWEPLVVFCMSSLVFGWRYMSHV